METHVTGWDGAGCPNSRFYYKWDKCIAFKVRSLRMSGSCAMDLCGVACGRLDMFYEIGFGGPWSGRAFSILSHGVCSSNSHLKEAAVEALRGNC
ncbi:hypothetical protein R1flu_021305 [Riccia fluitans]|uniref:Uncharacterized protein n=1 Tax=Riccia fluitans TaxID=41844 RepID=A0ABD1ZNZ2_9MARC